MYCKNCGIDSEDDTRFCSHCGTQTEDAFESPSPAVGGKVGYSERINDPAFARYIKDTNRWAGIFSLILAIAAVIGFYIYGETSPDMNNPEALFIGFGIGGMFILIALYTIIARKRSKTWDGVVVDKTIKKKSRRIDTGNNDSAIRYYTEYGVIVRDEKGKKHYLTAADDMTVFDYYQIGDHVRRHAGLNSFEKYDKSMDSIIFCNACKTLCQINDDYCHRCKCPLLV